MEENSPEYEKELERRISILTDNGKKDSIIEQLQKFDFMMMGIIVVVSFLIFYWGWQ
ncbi:hypothetical protein [Siminovitchia fortis]|uniref:hypothetical protein n=1 Tax=Siminovitchia fortis TaxID=254758 RepID=UPI0013E35F02|nr:hypothetical protein [Siminovitchia fortis]WHY82095.1 hypothetical protein QNH23_01305 [Siminovitchia fortis]